MAKSVQRHPQAPQPESTLPDSNDDLTEITNDSQLWDDKDYSDYET